MVNFSVNIERPYIELEGDKHYTWTQVAKLFRVLADSKEEYVHYFKLYDDLDIARFSEPDRYLRQLVHRVRNITEPYGLFVHTKRDYGYVLTEANKAQQALKKLELEVKLKST